MTFHNIGKFIIPTDFNSIIFQRGRAQPHTNQLKIAHLNLAFDLTPRRGHVIRDLPKPGSPMYSVGRLSQSRSGGAATNW